MDSDAAAGAGVMAVMLVPILIGLVILVAVIVGMIKTFMKMGYSNAWWLIIPILNIIFILKVIGKPMWWILLLFIPCVGSLVGIYLSWLLSDAVAKAYGKGTGYAVGLFLVGFIFYPILGFGSEQPTKGAAA